MFDVSLRVQTKPGYQEPKLNKEVKNFENQEPKQTQEGINFETRSKYEIRNFRPKFFI